MILHPRFYQSMPANRAEERRKLGLDPALPAGLVLFGGYGSQSMVRIAKRLTIENVRTQLIFLCGRNRALFDQLSKLKLPFPVHVQGFTEQVAHYMWLSEYFIGKPGPGSVSEALAMGLPVIVEAGNRTLAHDSEPYRLSRNERTYSSAEQPGSVRSARSVGKYLKRGRDIPPHAARVATVPSITVGARKEVRHESTTEPRQ
jgi:hypothetical protein